MPFCPQCGEKNDGGAFCGKCGANLGAPVAVASPPVAVAQPATATAYATTAPTSVGQPVAVSQDGCCAGPNGCIGTVILILCILNLGTLPISIPGLMLAGALMNCCCQEQNVRCLAKTTAWLSYIVMGLGLIYGIALIAVLGDVYCAGIFGADVDWYRDNKDLVTAGCDICQGASFLCASPDDKGRCDACDFIRGPLGGIVIGTTLALDLPVAVLSTVVACRKRGTLPGERRQAV